jgi:hypothetical protein
LEFGPIFSINDGNLRIQGGRGKMEWSWTMVMSNGHEQWSNAFFNLTRIFQRTMEGNGTTMAIDQKINQP